MRDRTKELGTSAQSSDDDDEGTALMIKSGTGASMKDDKENEAFFRKVQEIREGLEALKKKVSELENKQKTVLGVALPEDSMKKELQTLRDEIKVLASQIHKKLKSIEPKKTDEDAKYVSISLRMQRTQHGVLSRNFVEVMAECNTIQAKYRNKNVERIQRQLKITGNDVSDEQLETMLESGQTDVFTQNILGDAKATKMALNEIETRHEEILKLERSIKDLHDMFQYLAMEVEAQGETVNRIENNIINSTNYIEKAVEETGAAVVSQKKARKKKVWIAICCAILILIIVIALAASFAG
ncbi:syntaxin-4 [Electrophorus electricus]|uniref:t-SNARE coiled-coil homology domain-containing protein n=1 Tax=Electrophorus electricus TaxID=8005 RepID=A0A4W4FGC7_ELEEL|nr:syntaxin-4 [Electrophorus electricus]